MVSDYNTKSPYGVRNLFQIVAKRLTIQGFSVTDLAPKYEEQFVKQVGSWLVNNEIRYVEDIAESIDVAPVTFVGMLHGENFGKQVVHIADL